MNTAWTNCNKTTCAQKEYNKKYRTTLIIGLEKMTALQSATIRLRVRRIVAFGAVSQPTTAVKNERNSNVRISSYTDLVLAVRYENKRWGKQS